MGIVALVSQILEVILLAPRIFVSILAFPVNRRFLPRFVALDRPFSGPGESFALDVVAFFGRLRW
jgi:hypothetical protein